MMTPLARRLEGVDWLLWLLGLGQIGFTKDTLATQECIESRSLHMTFDVEELYDQLHS